MVKLYEPLTESPQASINIIDHQAAHFTLDQLNKMKKKYVN